MNNQIDLISDEALDGVVGGNFFNNLMYMARGGEARNTIPAVAMLPFGAFIIGGAAAANGVVSLVKKLWPF